jgi:hypothetical protein
MAIHGTRRLTLACDSNREVPAPNADGWREKSASGTPLDATLGNSPILPDSKHFECRH